MDQCPVNSFMVPDTNNTVCKKCHHECDQNYHCANGQSTGCQKCKNFTVFKGDIAVSCVFFFFLLIKSLRQIIVAMRQRMPKESSIFESGKWRMFGLRYCIKTAKNKNGYYWKRVIWICSDVLVHFGKFF